MSEPKLHSYEWFQAEVAKVRAEVATWPQWMRDGMHYATASFPIVGDDSGERACCGTLHGSAHRVPCDKWRG